jgi:PAS domain S-box-containing protein
MRNSSTNPPRPLRPEKIDRHMTPREAKLLQQVKAARNRSEALYRRAEKSSARRALLDEALRELSNAHEQLRVAMEELRWQNDQLIATRGLSAEQRRHYREMFEFAPDGYLVTDTAGTIQEANHKAAELLGVREHFLMGKPMVIFIPEPEHQAFRELLARLEKGAEIPSWEMQMQPRDGSSFPAAMTVSVIRQSQASGWHPIGLRWLVRDMTERKKVEDQIQRQLGCITTVRDINLAITSTLELRTVLDLLLEKLERLFPYPTAATVRLFNQKTGELEPLCCRNLDPAEWKAGGSRSPRARLEEVIRSRAPLVVRDVQTDSRTHRPDFYRRNGLVSYLGMPLIIAEEIIGFLCLYTKEEHEFGQEEIEFLNSVAVQAAIAIQNSRLYEQVKHQAAELLAAHDEMEERVRGRTFELAATNEMLTAEVRERRRIEERLRESEGRLSELANQLEKQLIASDRLVSVGELAASVAHELNNPLQIILGYAQELLEEAKPSEPHHEPLKIIETETRRCREIIRNLLDFARPVDAERVLSSVEPIVLNGVKLVLHFLQIAKIKMDIEIPPDLPPIYADSQQLQQVLMNLVFNAAEAMPGGGKLTIRALKSQGRENLATELIITVSDTGTGIASDNLVHIFRPFFTTKKKKGMGLGLAICERIMEAHGGRIFVESDPGKGTTFHLHFPLKESREYGRAS